MCWYREQCHTHRDTTTNTLTKFMSELANIFIRSCLYANILRYSQRILEEKKKKHCDKKHFNFFKCFSKVSATYCAINTHRDEYEEPRNACWVEQ